MIFRNDDSQAVILYPLGSSINAVLALGFRGSEPVLPAACPRYRGQLPKPLSRATGADAETAFTSRSAGEMASADGLT